MATCLHESQSFDISREFTLGFWSTKVTLLKSSDVCSLLSFNNIKWNKCIRSFLYKWCNVLIVKFIILFFMPISQYNL